MKYSKQIVAKLTLLLIGASVSSTVLAQERARVVSSTPVVKQFTVPQQNCETSQVFVGEPKSAAGAAIGAVAGGLIGNALGSGASKAASTALGAIGGAVVGDSVASSEESINRQAQTQTTCTVQNTAQSLTVYQVVYEYAGKQYSVEMPNDPGPSILIQVSPAPQGVAPLIGSAPTQYASPLSSTTTVTPVPVYVGAPYPYPYPYPYAYAYPYGYVAPVGISFGYYRGWGGRRH
jgi:uncharacterized protein YcfJ